MELRHRADRQLLKASKLCRRGSVADWSFWRKKHWNHSEADYFTGRRGVQRSGTRVLGPEQFTSLMGCCIREGLTGDEVNEAKRPEPGEQANEAAEPMRDKQEASRSQVRD